MHSHVPPADFPHDCENNGSSSPADVAPFPRREADSTSGHLGHQPTVFELAFQRPEQLPLGRVARSCWPRCCCASHRIKHSRDPDTPLQRANKLSEPRRATWRLTWTRVGDPSRLCKTALALAPQARLLGWPWCQRRITWLSRTGRSWTTTNVLVTVSMLEISQSRRLLPVSRK